MEDWQVHNMCILIWSAPTPYHALGCQVGASHQEIQLNYRKLRKIILPFVEIDALYGEALVRVGRAWALLKCNESRRVIDQRFGTNDLRSSGQDEGGGATDSSSHAQAIDWRKVILRIPPMDLPSPEPRDDVCLDMICELCDPCETPELKTLAICIGRYDKGDDQEGVSDIPVIVCPTCAKFVRKIAPESTNNKGKAKSRHDDEHLAMLEQRQLDEAIRESLCSLPAGEADEEDAVGIAIARSLEQAKATQSPPSRTCTPDLPSL